jgi:uncharacterized membrane protein
MLDKMTDVFLYWVVYSSIGWVVETIYCSMLAGRLVERGFLNGPMCPMYGFGALIAVYLLGPFSQNMFEVFILSATGASILEYSTSVVMEKMFNMRWWDYSDLHFNIEGRIALTNSIYSGIMGILIILYLHPFLSSILTSASRSLKLGMASIILGLVVIDIAVSVRSAMSLGHRVAQIEDIKLQMRAMMLGTVIVKGVTGMRSRGGRIALSYDRRKESFSGNMESLRGSIEDYRRSIMLRRRLRRLYAGLKYSERRLLKSFPNLRSVTGVHVVDDIKRAIREIGSPGKSGKGKI